MLLDGNTQFVPLGSPLAVPTTELSNYIDLLGVGVGQAPPSIIGTAATFGTDQGLGDGDRLIQVNVGTAFVTADAATLQIQLLAYPDLGAGGNYQPGASTILGETGTFTAAQLTAGSIHMKFPILPSDPATLRPRYLALNFVVPGGLSFSAGTIAWAGVINGRDDQGQLQQCSNYTV